MCPNPFSMHCFVHVCVIAAISSSHLVMKDVRLLEFGIELSGLSDQTLCLVDPAGSQGDCHVILNFSGTAIVGVISKSA
jgi:hypothetical protein